MHGPSLGANDRSLARAFRLLYCMRPAKELDPGATRLFINGGSKGAAVRRKQLVSVLGIIVLASTLSALVAYRLGLRRSARPFSSSPAATSAAEMIGCVDFRGAAEHTGKRGCVSGRVLRVFTSRAGNTFLDFCPDYRQCPFTGVVFAEDRESFGDLGSLWGKQVEIRGLITTYKGRAEIIIREPDQIRVVH